MIAPALIGSVAFPFQFTNLKHHKHFVQQRVSNQIDIRAKASAVPSVLVDQELQEQRFPSFLTSMSGGAGR
jgi:hypothetical protein